MKHKVKLSRIVYSCVTLVYFAAVVCATVYAQTGYHQALPLVEIGSPQEGVIPKSCVQTDPESGKLYLNVVVQENGPWGKRYVISTVDMNNYRVLDEEHYVIFGATRVENPIVFSSESEYLYKGMEVRLQ